MAELADAPDSKSGALTGVWVRLPLLALDDPRGRGYTWGMQTFLPHPNYHVTAQALDMRRLGKQRVETLQILKALHDPTYGWQNHPAVNMWRGHADHLIDYGLVICNEWTGRGYKDTCTDKIAAMRSLFPNHTPHPWWFGHPDFHHSHQGVLYRKDPIHYAKYEPYSDRDYWWPTRMMPFDTAPSECHTS